MSSLVTGCYLTAVHVVSQSEHIHTISCNHFEFYCMNHRALVPLQPGMAPPEFGSPMAAMSEDSIKRSYEMQQISPMFYPNLTEIGSRISGNNFARMLGAAMAQNDWNKLDEVRRGNNIAPPEVGLIYDAYVTKQGTIFNPVILIEAWPDTPSRWSDFINDYLGVEGNDAKQKWRDVDQVVVLTHTHQNMFWHWMVSEAYRLLLVYRFLLENPDIYIHIWGGAPLIQKWHDIFGIDKYALPLSILARLEGSHAIFFIDLDSSAKKMYAQSWFTTFNRSIDQMCHL